MFICCFLFIFVHNNKKLCSWSCTCTPYLYSFYTQTIPIPFQSGWEPKENMEQKLAQGVGNWLSAMQETADTSSCDEEQEKEKEPLVVMPYVAGMSEDIRSVCRKFNIRVVFMSGRTLHSMLTKVKDTLPLGKQSNVVYRIPCSCGQVYIRETKRRLETRLKEHRDACEKGWWRSQLYRSMRGRITIQSTGRRPQYWTTAEDKSC